MNVPAKNAARIQIKYIFVIYMNGTYKKKSKKFTVRLQEADKSKKIPQSGIKSRLYMAQHT
jgi:hypothetical protein